MPSHSTCRTRIHAGLCGSYARMETAVRPKSRGRRVRMGLHHHQHDRFPTSACGAAGPKRKEPRPMGILIDATLRRTGSRQQTHKPPILFLTLCCDAFLSLLGKYRGVAFVSQSTVPVHSTCRARASSTVVGNLRAIYRPASTLPLSSPSKSSEEKNPIKTSSIFAKMSKLQADHLFCLPVAIPVSIAFNLAAALSSPLLSPVVTGAALYALTRSPEQVRGPILTTLQKYLSNSTIKRSVTTLSVVFGLGLVRQVHLFLSDLALNNFRFRSEKRRYDWPNEIAVVTGAAGGIGSIMVKDLMSKGVKVMALDIAPQLPDSLLAQSVGRVAYYQCDLTDRDAVMAVAKRIQAEHGDPSILINNAGIAYTHTTLQATSAALDKIFAINTIAPYWTIQAFLPAMLRNRKGHIAVTASMASWIGSPALGPYSATKVGVLAVHESLRQELRSIHNCPEILVTNAHPTFVRTPMTTSSIEWLEQMTSLIEPEEVSNGVMRNIFACRGGEVIMPGGLGMLPTYLRCMPHWMSYALLRTGEARAPEMDVSAERRMA